MLLSAKLSDDTATPDLYKNKSLSQYLLEIHVRDDP